MTVCGQCEEKKDRCRPELTPDDYPDVPCTGQLEAGEEDELTREEAKEIIEECLTEAFTAVFVEIVKPQLDLLLKTTRRHNDKLNTIETKLFSRKGKRLRRKEQGAGEDEDEPSSSQLEVEAQGEPKGT